MKFTQILHIAGLVALGATEVLRNRANVNAKFRDYQNLIGRGDEDDYSPSPSPGLRPAEEALWHVSKCRGAKLMFATTQNPPEAIRFLNPLESQWNSDLRLELVTWGYRDGTSDPDRDCSLDGIKIALDALDLPSLTSSQGAPNYCFSVTHCDSDIVERNPNGALPERVNQHYSVNGRRYRVTGAFATIVINPEAGVIYLLRRGSPVSEARDLWGINDEDPVPIDELPALRASSDIAWGFWKRISGAKISEIKLFISTAIINSETERIIDRALEAAGLDALPLFPGLRIEVATESYLAILGSPNARAVGYFLAQHKTQLGGNRYVSGIAVFRSRADSELPNLAFFVDWAPNPPLQAPTVPIDVLIPPPAHGGEVVKRSEDGKSVVREHVIRA